MGSKCRLCATAVTDNSAECFFGCCAARFSLDAAEQILSKMDGLVNLQNVLVVGMTNRKELLDEALLRPGRMEVRN